MRTFDDVVRDHFEPDESYTFYFHSEEGEHYSRVRGSACVDVVHSFYHFMLGSGFHSDTIVSAFEQIAEEMNSIDKVALPACEANQ